MVVSCVVRGGGGGVLDKNIVNHPGRRCNSTIYCSDIN